MKTYQKIVLAAGTGMLGKALTKRFSQNTAEIVVLSRSPRAKSGNVRTVVWDGRNPGNWCNELEGADLLVNLTGRSINCRHTSENKKLILESRINAVNALAQAVEHCKTPPAVWVQASAGAIYLAGGQTSTENGSTNGSGFMADVCRSWEAVFNNVGESNGGIRKVILRIGIVLGKNEGAFPKLKALAKLGLGGKAGDGKQMMSWIHEEDLASMIEWITINNTISGPVNCCSPEPLSNADFMKTLRGVMRMPIGLPAPAFAIKMAAALMDTEASLVLDSMWMSPEKIVQSGFTFSYPKAKDAFINLIQ